MKNKPKFKVGDWVSAEVYEEHNIAHMPCAMVVAVEKRQVMNQKTQKLGEAHFYTIEAEGKSQDGLVEDFDKMSRYKKHFVRVKGTCRGYIVPIPKRSLRRRGLVK